KVAATIDGPVPRTRPQNYAREALYLNEEPRRELMLKALRIGDMGIAAIPNEVFALTGLKLKALSPLETTFTIELANGAEGDIPGNSPADAAGNRPATYEDGVAFFLDGPPSTQFSGDRTVNRAAHFAGGRLRAELDDPGASCSVELWFWNGLPTDARGITGY